MLPKKGRAPKGRFNERAAKTKATIHTNRIVRAVTNKSKSARWPYPDSAADSDQRTLVGTGQSGAASPPGV